MPPRSEIYARAIAIQLAIALSYVVLFRIQMAIPDIPGSAIASAIFIPSIVRVAGTLLAGPLAFFGLFGGSFMIAQQYPWYEAQAFYHAFASAASAPLTCVLFGLLGLVQCGRGHMRRPDPAIVFLFIACYAVMNAGLHMIGLSILKSEISPHIPYFLIMVAGDIIPPAGGFAAYLILKTRLPIRKPPA